MKIPKWIFPIQSDPRKKLMTEREFFNLRHQEMFGVVATDKDWEDYYFSPREIRVAFDDDIDVRMVIISAIFWAFVVLSITGAAVFLLGK